MSPDPQQRENADLDLVVVAREIDAAVGELTSTGGIDPATERELEALFWQYAPLSGRGSDHSRALYEALRVVDATAYVDPLVPVASGVPGGSLIKKSLRKLYLWWAGWMSNQISHHHVAVGRSLHLIEEELEGLRNSIVLDEGDRQVVIAPSWANELAAWWIAPALAIARGVGGRVLHLASGDGWLVEAMVNDGVDAYGLDPRLASSIQARHANLDLRTDSPRQHLKACAKRSLSAIVVSGVIEALDAQQRDQLIEEMDRVTGSRGVIVIHSLSQSTWADPELGPEADLAPGRPLRSSSWTTLAERHARRAEVLEGPDGRDYLVILRAIG